MRGFAAAALLGLVTLALAGLGVLFILPVLVFRRWRRRTHATVR